MSDDYEKGLITDLTNVDRWCQNIAGQIAGKEIKEGLREIDGLPIVAAKGLAALLTGEIEKTKNH
jgi:hypothetical protein